MPAITDTDTVLHNTNTKETIKVSEVQAAISTIDTFAKYNNQTLDVLVPGDADWIEGATVTIDINLSYSTT